MSRDFWFEKRWRILIESTDLHSPKTWTICFGYGTWLERWIERLRYELSRLKEKRSDAIIYLDSVFWCTKIAFTLILGCPNRSVLTFHSPFDSSSLLASFFLIVSSSKSFNASWERIERLFSSSRQLKESFLATELATKKGLCLCSAKFGLNFTKFFRTPISLQFRRASSFLWCCYWLVRQKEKNSLRSEAARVKMHFYRRLFCRCLLRLRQRCWIK